MRKRSYLDPQHLSFILYRKMVKDLGQASYFNFVLKHWPLDGNLDYLRRRVAIRINNSLYLNEKGE